MYILTGKHALSNASIFSGEIPNALRRLGSIRATEAKQLTGACHPGAVDLNLKARLRFYEFEAPQKWIQTTWWI